MHLWRWLVVVAVLVAVSVLREGGCENLSMVVQQVFWVRLMSRLSSMFRWSPRVWVTVRISVASE